MNIGGIKIMEKDIDIQTLEAIKTIIASKGNASATFYVDKHEEPEGNRGFLGLFPKKHVEVTTITIKLRNS